MKIWRLLSCMVLYVCRHRLHAVDLMLHMHPVYEFDFCRLCLCSSVNLLDIFTENDCHESFFEVIQDLLRLKVAKEDCLPWLICHSCLAQLSEFRDFKARSLRSKVVFDGIFQARASEINRPSHVNKRIKLDGAQWKERYPSQLEGVVPASGEEDKGEHRGVIAASLPISGSTSALEEAQEEEEEQVEYCWCQRCGVEFLSRRELRGHRKWCRGRPRSISGPVIVDVPAVGALDSTQGSSFDPSLTCCRCRVVFRSRELLIRHIEEYDFKCTAKRTRNPSALAKTTRNGWEIQDISLRTKRNVTKGQRSVSKKKGKGVRKSNHRVGKALHCCHCSRRIQNKREAVFEVAAGPNTDLSEMPALPSSTGTAVEEHSAIADERRQLIESPNDCFVCGKITPNLEETELNFGGKTSLGPNCGCEQITGKTGDEIQVINPEFIDEDCISLHEDVTLLKVLNSADVGTNTDPYCSKCDAVFKNRKAMIQHVCEDVLGYKTPVNSERMSQQGPYVGSMLSASCKHNLLCDESATSQNFDSEGGFSDCVVCSTCCRMITEMRKLLARHVCQRFAGSSAENVASMELEERDKAGGSQDGAACCFEDVVNDEVGASAKAIDVKEEAPSPGHMVVSYACDRCRKTYATKEELQEHVIDCYRLQEIQEVYATNLALREDVVDGSRPSEAWMAFMEEPNLREPEIDLSRFFEAWKSYAMAPELHENLVDPFRSPEVPEADEMNSVSQEHIAYSSQPAEARKAHVKELEVRGRMIDFSRPLEAWKAYAMTPTLRERAVDSFRSHEAQEANATAPDLGQNAAQISRSPTVLETHISEPFLRERAVNSFRSHKAQEANATTPVLGQNAAQISRSPAVLETHISEPFLRECAVNSFLSHEAQEANATMPDLGQNATQISRSPAVLETHISEPFLQDQVVDCYQPREPQETSELPPGVDSSGEPSKEVVDIGGEVMKYLCTFCSQRYRSIEALKEHIKWWHNASSIFVCEQCHNGFAGQEEFRRHRLSAHSEQEGTSQSAQGEGCQRRNPSDLRWRLLHSRKKLLIHNMYRKQAELNAHAEGNTLKKRYSCFNCTKRFSSMEARKQHLKDAKCNVPKRNQCAVCKKKFSTPSSLIQHYKDSHAKYSKSLLNIREEDCKLKFESQV